MSALGRIHLLLRRAGALGMFATAMLLPLLAQSKAEEASQFQSLLQRGFVLHEHADYQHSLPLLTSAWKLRPHNYFANLLIGIDLLRTGKAEEAISYLKEASRQRPSEDFPYDYIGEAQAVRGFYADAAEALTRAMQLAPGSAQAIESSIDIWVERFRQLSAGLRSTKKGLAAEYRLQAMSPAANGEKREELLEHAVNLDPNAPGVWSDLALADLAAASPAEARANTGRALQENPADLGARELVALLAAHDGDWQAAVEGLKDLGQRSPAALLRALKDWPAGLQPPSPHTSTIDGTASVFLKCAAEGTRDCPAFVVGRDAKTGAAQEPIEQLFQEQRWEALAAQPAPRRPDATGWRERGIALVLVDRYAAAIPPLERALALRKDDVYAQFLLSLCYAREAGRVVGALNHAEGGAAIGHLVRGDVLLRMQGNSAAAIAEYSAALVGHRGDPKILERLAEAQFENGSLAAADASAQAALGVDPYRFSAMRTLASVAIEQREYEKALPYLQQLAQHDPADPTAQVDLGVALAQTGNPTEALKYLEPTLRGGYADEKGSLHAVLGSVLRKEGRAMEATAAFAEARRLSDEYQRSSHRGGDEQKQQQSED